MLGLARAAVAELPVNDREMSGLTFAMNPKRIHEAKEYLRGFMDEFDAKFSASGSDPGGEVYQLHMALWPLSKPIGNDSE